jgi:L-ascorbate metabolism protein UlaG (beta-lactamase superfamily)
MGWDETRRFETARGTLKVRAFKVRHWGARMRHDLHRGFNGYLLAREGRQLCLMCDTARTDLENVGHDDPIDVMTVPIGAYNPWIASHCTPEEAVAMANQARARFVVPIHHQTFRLSHEPMDEPIRRFERAIEPERLALSHIGETFELR